MKFNKPFIVTLCLVIGLVLLQACSSAGNISKTSSSSRHVFSPESGVHEVKIKVKSNMVVNTLQITEVRVNDGQVVLRLYSPAGELQWEEILTAPTTYQQTYNLDATPGSWKLEIELKNASGMYDVLWRASD
jgi:hypothetical protein